MKRKSLVAVALVVVVTFMCGVGFGEKCEKENACLPSIVRAIVDAIFPAATIEAVESEVEGIEVIEVELTQGGKECSVDVTPCGIVLSIETEVSRDDVPAAVAKALKEKLGKLKITKIEKEEVRAVVKVVKLDKPVDVYEAKFVKDGKEYEIKVACCGKVLGIEAADEDEDADDDEDDDADDDADAVVSIKDVPGAVRATIKKISKGGKVVEIEREEEDGKVVYEAEIVYGDKEVDFKIAANGKILSKEVEDADDDDEEDADDDDDEDDDDDHDE